MIIFALILQCIAIVMFMVCPLLVKSMDLNLPNGPQKNYMIYMFKGRLALVAYLAGLAMITCSTAYFGTIFLDKLVLME